MIDERTYQTLRGISLQKTTTKAFAYNSTTPVPFLGKFTATVETRQKITAATFYVAQGSTSGNLLSLSTAQELDLVSLHLNNISKPLPQNPNKDPKLNDILERNAKVFDGLGKLKGQTVHLNIDPDANPKAQPQRRIPYHIRNKVKDAIITLEKDDIIERVPEDEPTPWVSPIVAVPKKDRGVRICVDMRQANEAIKRVRHPIPTVDDVRFELNGAKYFSKLDLSQAYHQLELDPKSRHITTFSTHIGLYRYKRLNYGTNAAAEIFQYTLQTQLQLQGLIGVKNIADDIIVYGSTRKEHDENLDKCLQRLTTRELTLNASKCKLLNPTLEFFGQIFSADGTRPDPQRVVDLQNVATPTTVQEVRSLLGMANYSSQYIPNFATITAPLRLLTKNDTPFVWTTVHKNAFDNLKAALTSAPCMAYFDIHKETFIVVDASPVGVSAILSQKSPNVANSKVIAYTSRALSPVETRYSQTEREALAIVWAVEHFHMFLFGHHFTLVTDHKPLEIIYGTTRSKPSARIERWVLRLQPYHFNVIYKPGATNPADYLSRHPGSPRMSHPDRMTEEYVNFIERHTAPPPPPEPCHSTKLPQLHVQIRLCPRS